jgi:arylsulfatase A-like enzyme
VKLTEELIRVPLLLRVPGSEKKDVSLAPFSLVHLAPTLLQAANIAAPPDFEGRSAWQQFRQAEILDTVAISECVEGCTNPFLPENRLGPRLLSVTDSRFKLVFFFGSQSEVLYDLEADRHEQNPLPSHAHSAIRKRLLQFALEHLRGSGNRNLRLRMQARLRELQLEWMNPALQPLPAAS